MALQEPYRKLPRGGADFWTPVSRAQLPGMIAAIHDVDYRSPVEVEYLRGQHVLLCTLTRPDMPYDCSFYQLSKRSFDLGRIFALPANTAYRAHQGAGRHRFLSITFDPEEFERVTGQHADWDVERCSDIRHADLSHALMRLVHELVEPGLASGTLMESISLSALVDLARVLDRTREEAATRPGLLSRAHLAQLTDAIEAAGTAAPTLAWLAGLIGVSRRHLTDAFKRTTGQTVHQYVAQVRTRRAEAMLGDTALPIKVIAHRLGFTSQAHFSAAFRASSGQTPSDWRRENRRRAV